MKTQEFTGKDVNEAINKACEALSLPREELDIEIITPGSTSIFGLTFKKAKIRVSIKKKNVEQQTAKPEEQRPAPRKKAPSRKPPRKEEVPVTEESTPVQPPSPAAQEKSAEQGEIAATAEKLLGELLALMGLPSEVTVSLGGKSLKAHIAGEHTDALIAEEGQVLDSIQYLLRKMLSKKFSEKVLITVDAGDYRATRRQELEKMARAIAEEVKQSGKSKSIPAMNPADRRIVHMAIQDDENIRSRSVGEGIFKKIIIFQPGKAGRKGPPRRRGRRPPQS